jgi:type IV pilus assembly protein PilF
MLKNSLFTGIMLVKLIILVSCSSTSKKNEQKSQIFFSAGTQALMDQNYTQALTNLIKADELSPNNPEILNNLAMAYFFKGEEDIAVKQLKQVIKIDSRNSDARLNLGSIYYKNGNHLAAEKLYKEVLKHLTYDKQARTFYNLGILELEKKKNIAAAESYFNKAVKEDENYCPAYFKLGLINMNRQQFKTALKNFKNSTMGTCVDNASAHYYQALTMIQLKQFTLARIKLDEIENKFKNTVYAVKAKSKILELNELEIYKTSNEEHAAGKLLQNNEF